MGQLYTFSDDAKFLALVDQMGALTIWDTATNALKQKYSPNFHLMGQVTTLTWATTLPEPTKKKNAVNEGTQLQLVLGTSKGQLHLYSYAEGQIGQQLKGKGHEGRVTCLTKVPGDNLLYSCGEDGQVNSWCMKEGRQTGDWSVGSEKCSSMVYVRSLEAVVLGFRQLKVYSVAKHCQLQVFTGHASDVHLLELLECAPNKTYVVSASRLERSAYIWKLNMRSKQSRSAIATLLMDDVAICLSSAKTNDDHCFQLISVTQNGVVHIYNLNFNEISSATPIKAQTTISITPHKVGTGNMETIRILAAHPFSCSTPFKVILAYGSEQCMAFEELTPKLDEPLQILLRADPKAAQTDKARQRTGLEADLKNKVLTPIIDEDQVQYKASNSMAPRSKKTTKWQDMPIESRIRNLQLETNSSSTPSGKGNSGFSAQSRVHLLIQALHSKDKKLLDSVLLNKDSRIIQVTVEKLPTQYVEPLVQQLVQMMHEKHLNIQCAVLWMKSLLQTHFSHIISWSPDELLSIFAPCLGMIEQRANCLNEMMKIRGRLQFLVEQIKRNASYKEESRTSSKLAALQINDGVDSDSAEEAPEKNDSSSDCDEMDVDDDELDEEEHALQLNTDNLEQSRIVIDSSSGNEDDDDDDDDADVDEDNDVVEIISS